MMFGRVRNALLPWPVVGGGISELLMAEERISDFGFQISDFRFQILDFGFWILKLEIRN